MEKTQSRKLAEEYLRLGGKRLAKIDDNIVDTRTWDEDTPEAEAFWQKYIQTLDRKKRAEVEVFLPSISDH
ncbi:hypothetical protein JNB88_27315 [Rhizobium cauense]|uniref:hypothetical protein n=1 Tax=Rhizobium cauense TaxID=1166683 RepID=UPI001C6F0D8F|nr:hypothetical protein [Rhizobium cauense]MBW9117333.1 hypothetical protein [Rhizobium cauense]